MYRVFIFILISTSLLLGAGFNSLVDAQSVVTFEHIKQINQKFKMAGIKNGYVDFDRYGRVKLLGEYEDELEVDKAFALAQSVVGPKWVSPVTPENIKLRQWQIEQAESLAELLGAKKPQIRVDRTKPPGPVKNKYALLVGIGRYMDRKITELPYTYNDVMDLYKYLTDPQGGKFKRENVRVLINEQATKDNVLREMNWLRSIAEPDDFVLVYISTHGTQPDKQHGVHVVTYDTVTTPPERIWHTSLTDKTWREFIENLRAQRIVLILDVCYSSGAFANIPGIAPSGGKSLGVIGVESYSINRDYVRRMTGAKDLIIEDTSKFQRTTSKSESKISDGWGLVLLSSSGENEQSWSDDVTRRSYFTYHFVEGLRLYNGSIRDAFHHARPIVQRRVNTEKSGYVKNEGTGKQEWVTVTQNPQMFVVFGNGVLTLK